MDRVEISCSYLFSWLNSTVMSVGWSSSSHAPLKTVLVATLLLD